MHIFAINDEAGKGTYNDELHFKRRQAVIAEKVRMAAPSDWRNGLRFTCANDLTFNGCGY